MSCLPKPTLGNILVRNTPIVFFTVYLFDFLYYGFIAGSPSSFFGKSIFEIIMRVVLTAVLAFLFGYLYARASRIWRDGDSPESPGEYDYTIAPFVCKAELRSHPKASCKASCAKIINGILFSLMTSSFFFFALLLGGLTLSLVYIFIFHGIRGGDDAIRYTDAALKTGEIVLAGVLLETHGKTESDGDY